MRQRANQSGFSTSVILLAVLVVAALAVTGLVVYQHHKPSSTKSTAATSSSQPATTQPKNSTTTQPAATTTQTLDIKEWGVHLTLDSTTASLYYYIKPSLPNVAYLSLKTVSNVAPDCAADQTSLAAIGRLTEADQQAIVSNSTPGIPGIVHVGSYWYSYAKPNASCMPDAATQQAVAKAQPSYDLQSVVKTLAADN